MQAMISRKARALDIIGNLSGYFTLKISSEGITAQIKGKAVARRLNKKGLYIIYR